jgi:hypothetical protein
MTPSSPAWMPLLAPATVRTRCAAIATAVASNASTHWKLSASALAPMAQAVLAHWQAQGAQPFAPAPPWNADGEDRESQLLAALAPLPALAQAQALLDLHVLHAVLLAEPAPPAPWAYRDGGTLDKIALPGARHAADDLLQMLNAAGGPAAATQVATVNEATASDATSPPEAVDASTLTSSVASPVAAQAADATGNSLSGRAGLSVALLRAFLAGAFSSDRAEPWRADALALRQIDGTALRALLQSTPANPVPGLDAMAQRLAALAERPGSQLLGRWLDAQADGKGTATRWLADLITFCGPACSGKPLLGAHLGDVFSHPWGGGSGATEGLVPLHGQAQALVRQLAAHPLLHALGLRVPDLAQLCVNPGLRLVNAFIEQAVLVPRDTRDLQERRWPRAHELVQEARALALHFSHELAHRLSEATGAAAAPDLQAAIEACATAGAPALKLQAR